MDVEALDLRDERCPMALLLAKRRCHHLLVDQTLTIWSQDKASINDMVRFFSQPPYSIKVQQQSDFWALLVTKKEEN